MKVVRVNPRKKLRKLCSFVSSALFIIALLSCLLSLVRVDAAPAFCRTCRGPCRNETDDQIGATNEPTSAEDVTYEIMEQVIEEDAGLSQVEELKRARRAKRASSVERQPCDNKDAKFQLEMLIIPIAIMMIPVALCSLLMCVCYCGPEDSRGKVPEKMFGVKLPHKKKEQSDDDELEYKDGYVQRRDSKKTRFSTNVTVIGDRAVKNNGSYYPATIPTMVIHCPKTNINGYLTNMDNNTESKSEGNSTEKKTRFSDNISIVGGNMTPVETEQSQNHNGMSRS
ncbi:hypothetical protein DdX_05654 [Ditylenchus destructor]|uniref:Uncharacterized protein n=1 Tax=Ditylenchus destructor TaxID=166010 RepID=A0AAD4N7Z6_9BILA|nr:hypothetical protein DdX_05654 [Ditylenchus destructor]